MALRRKPRLLDLFCGAGGCAVGYDRAGFDVTGVDIKAQPHYPFEFLQMNAIELLEDLGSALADDYDAIHASPPCQAYTHARHLNHRGRNDNPRLIAPIRALLRATGLPYVIENVEAAKSELVNPIMLCGDSFGLEVERHRLFELGGFFALTPPCDHSQRGEPRFPGTPRDDGSRPLSRVANQMASGISHVVFAAAMRIDWIPATGFRPTNQLREAIPPAYTEWIGKQLMAALEVAA